MEGDLVVAVAEDNRAYGETVRSFYARGCGPAFSFRGRKAFILSRLTTDRRHPMLRFLPLAFNIGES
jgi:hypothetical protein